MNRRLVTILLVSAVVLLGAEAGVRLISPYLPDQVDWYDPASQEVVEQMDRLAARGQSVDTVFTGTSMMGLGFRPETFDPGPSQPSVFNASLAGGVPELCACGWWRRWSPARAPERWSTA